MRKVRYLSWHFEVNNDNSNYGVILWIIISICFLIHSFHKHAFSTYVLLIFELLASCIRTLKTIPNAFLRPPYPHPPLPPKTYLKTVPSMART